MAQITALILENTFLSLVRLVHLNDLYKDSIVKGLEKTYTGCHACLQPHRPLFSSMELRKEYCQVTKLTVALATKRAKRRGNPTLAHERAMESCEPESSTPRLGEIRKVCWVRRWVPQWVHNDLRLLSKSNTPLNTFLDDTWSQPGYWESIAEFIENLPSDSCAKWGTSGVHLNLGSFSPSVLFILSFLIFVAGAWTRKCHWKSIPMILNLEILNMKSILMNCAHTHGIPAWCREGVLAVIRPLFPAMLFASL